jgi:hypothetical protein
MVFDDGEFPESKEEMMECWAQMTSARLARNTEIGAKKGKAVTKKASAPSSARGGEAESSTPRKSKAKAKEADDVVLDIDEALRRGNKLSTKTRPQDIDKIYRALEIGLADCFPYKKIRIPGAFHSDRLHIAPDSMKYRRILKSRLEQVTSLNRPLSIVLVCISWQPIHICVHASDPCWDVRIGRRLIQILDLWIPDITFRPFLFGPPTLIRAR